MTLTVTCLQISASANNKGALIALLNTVVSKKVRGAATSVLELVLESGRLDLLAQFLSLASILGSIVSSKTGNMRTGHGCARHLSLFFIKQ